MQELLKRLGIESVNAGAWAGAALDGGEEEIVSSSPATNAPIAAVRMATLDQYEAIVAEAARAFKEWRMLPAPKRGEIVWEMAQAFRAHKQDLGAMVSLEVGKIRAEGLGEVQETIDIADFAVGLSRQLYGLTMPSERARHRMFEQWHPLGVVGVITAFNFPNAVWAWNAMLAAVCGDSVVWKPSLKAPLTAIATHKIADAVLARHGWSGLFGLVIGRDKTIGETMIHDHRMPLISATGSVRMGKHVAQVVAGRLGRTLLELGGNNAVIVEKDADLDLALRGLLFAAVGTAGQRCTTTRRLFVHEAVADTLVSRLVKAYQSVPIGDPLQDGVLCGPLIDADAVAQFERAVATAVSQGGEVLVGGQRVAGEGNFVQPTIIKATPDMPICQEETFAPILYVFPYSDLVKTIEDHNNVPQGLSSAIFTDSLRASERFLSPEGSDCGIANVNIGTSGAEIGGAFGGEKETGGGRESGSDSWKAYMRRQTCTVNYSKELPLAQGIKFEL